MLRRLIVLYVICNLIFLFCPVQVHAARDELQDELNRLHREFDEYRSELQQTEARRDDTQEKLKETRSRENTLLSLLENYQNEIRTNRNRLARQRRQADEALQRLREVEAELSNLQSDLDEREEILQKRLRGIYKHGELLHGQAIFTSDSMEDLVTRSRYFREIINHDQDIINNYRQTLQRLRELRSEREDVLQNRRALARQIRQSLNQLEETRERQQDVLGEVKNRRDFYRRQMEELESRQNQLRDVVLDLQRERSAVESRLERLGHQFARYRGELPWPVESREILRPFGRWREGEIVHTNEGIDIEVTEGSEVKVVAPGEVVFASPYRGMGKVAIVRHGDSFITLYGSLVELDVERGDEVGTGTRLGRAGQTVGLQQPRLYFQIFEGRNILDPGDWLE